MSKNKKTTGLKNTLLGQKVPIKPTSKDIHRAEKIVETIHHPRKTLVKMTIETPVDLYTEVKVRIARRNVTLKNYILQLIREDLEQE